MTETNMNITPAIRRTTKADAANLAIISDIASGGLSHWRWQQQVENGDWENALACGRDELGSDDNLFGYQYGVVVEFDGIVAGGFVSRALPTELDDDAFIREGVLAPLGELTALARGGWFIDSIAIFDEYRRRGIGSFMLMTAEKIAHEAGHDEIFLIARNTNISALNLYEDNGFRDIDSRQFIDWRDGSKPENEKWLLMKRKIAHTAKSE